jgi:hypothetical protein
VAQALGDRFTLYVNGVQVLSRTDGVLADGGVGVFVGGDLNEVVIERLLIQAPD